MLNDQLLANAKYTELLHVLSFILFGGTDCLMSFDAWCFEKFRAARYILKKNVSLHLSREL